MGTVNAFINIAKWQIKVNGTLIENETENIPIELKNAKDNTTNIDIDSDDEIYFDIEINPKGTEVATWYSIFVDLEESNLPTGTKITKYEKYEGTVTTAISTVTVDNTKTSEITETINLPDTQTSLNDNSIRKYRFYLKMPFPIPEEYENKFVQGNSTFTIEPNIKIKQQISE
jgi:hypothetical protein